MGRQGWKRAFRPGSRLRAWLVFITVIVVAGIPSFLVGLAFGKAAYEIALLATAAVVWLIPSSWRRRDLSRWCGDPEPERTTD